MRFQARIPFLFCLFISIVLTMGCGSGTQKAGDGASSDAPFDVAGTVDGSVMCTYSDGGALADAGASNNTCAPGGCPSGTICVAEVGGVAGGGGAHCAPIPTECHGVPSCACMASCACASGIGGHPETCTYQNDGIYCDNGIR
jgi:hypothetical protein